MTRMLVKPRAYYATVKNHLKQHKAGTKLSSKFLTKKKKKEFLCPSQEAIGLFMKMYLHRPIKIPGFFKRGRIEKCLT